MKTQYVGGQKKLSGSVLESTRERWMDERKKGTGTGQAHSREEESSISRLDGVTMVTDLGERCHHALVDSDMAGTHYPSPRDRADRGWWGGN